MSADTDADTEVAPWRDEDRLRRLYVRERLTVHEVAAHFDCAPCTISRWLDRHGIETGAGGKSNQYSDAELIEHLRTANGNCNFRVSKSDIDAIDGPSASTYVFRFKSWDDALEAAGIDPDEPTRQSSPQPATIDQHKRSYLARNRSVARALVRIDPPVRRNELDLSRSDFHRCVSEGLLVKHSDGAVYDVDIDNYSCLWEPREDITEWIERSLELAGGCPASGCLSTGVKNIGDGEFTCTNGDCDCRFDRETAAEVLDE